MKKILLSIKVGRVCEFKVRTVGQPSEMMRTQNKQVFPDDNTRLPSQKPSVEVEAGGSVVQDQLYIAM